MSIVSRKFSASPKRAAAETWEAISMAITNKDEGAKKSLVPIAGIAASIIADGHPASSPITLVGSGARLRIYCLYGENATEEDEHEDVLSWNPFETEWQIHFPVEAGDFDAYDRMVKTHGTQFAVYKVGEAVKGEETSTSPAPQLTIDVESLKKHV